jgi:splicing factor 3A subunit 1
VCVQTLLLVQTLTQSLCCSSAVIDRTALFVARSANPPLFEDKIREGQRSDPKFSFLNPLDPYHGYYRHRMEKISMGDLEDEYAPDKGDRDGEKESPGSGTTVDVGQESPQPEFIMDLPNISSIDLYVQKSLSHCSQLIFVFRL